MAETIFGSIEGSSRARGGGAAPAAPEKRSVMMESAQSMLTAVSAASSERAGRRGAETDHRLSARNVDRIQAFLDRPYRQLGEGADAVRARAARDLRRGRLRASLRLLHDSYYYSHESD